MDDKNKSNNKNRFTYSVAPDLKARAKDTARKHQSGITGQYASIIATGLDVADAAVNGYHIAKEKKEQVQQWVEETKQQEGEEDAKKVISSRLSDIVKNNLFK